MQENHKQPTSRRWHPHNIRKKQQAILSFFILSSGNFFLQNIPKLRFNWFHGWQALSALDSQYS